MDATYKADLKETNELNWERFKATLHAESSSMREEMASLRGDIREEMASLRGELRTEMKAMQSDLMKWMFIYWTGTVAAIIGMGYFGPK